MKRALKAVLSFLSLCGMAAVAAIIYVALTFFPPRNRF